MVKKPAKKGTKKVQKVAPKQDLQLWKLSTSVESMAMRIGQLGSLVAIVAERETGDTSDALWLIADLFNEMDKTLTNEAERIMAFHREAVGINAKW